MTCLSQYPAFNKNKTHTHTNIRFAFKIKGRGKHSLEIECDMPQILQLANKGFVSY